MIATPRLKLRKFAPEDLDALFALLRNEAVNTFLPWFPAKSRADAEAFYLERRENPYFFAVCLKQQPEPIGYIKVSDDESHDFGYALRREFWHQGIATEAGRALLEHLRGCGVPFITATHDINNPRSGGVMQNLGMTYCYSYEEQWQPKDFPVIFRMYQLNLDGKNHPVYDKYWKQYPHHFIETDVRRHS